MILFGNYATFVFVISRIFHLINGSDFWKKKHASKSFAFNSNGILDILCLHMKITIVTMMTSSTAPPFHHSITPPLHHSTALLLLDLRSTCRHLYDLVTRKPVDTSIIFSIGSILVRRSVLCSCDFVIRTPPAVGAVARN